MEQIQDGTGKGYIAKVDVNNRLHTDSVNLDRGDDASAQGFGFNINTGIITLTNAATKNAILYLKNNEDYDIVVESIIYGNGLSASGTGELIFDIVKNPTAGTIVSGATAVDINQNRNFGSSRTLSVTAYKGATGLTLTDGTKAIESLYGVSAQRVVISIHLIIPKGASIGINVTTPTGNTSMKVSASLSLYLETEAGQFN